MIQYEVHVLLYRAKVYLSLARRVIIPCNNTIITWLKVNYYVNFRRI